MILKLKFVILRMKLHKDVLFALREASASYKVFFIFIFFF